MAQNQDGKPKKTRPPLTEEEKQKMAEGRRRAREAGRYPKRVLTEEHKQKMAEGRRKARKAGKIVTPPEQLEAMHEGFRRSIENGMKLGRPPKTDEQKAEDLAKRLEERYKREREHIKENKIKLGAEIIAHEQTMTELEARSSDVAKIRARFVIDKENLSTHNKYITYIATLPLINYDDPEQVRERTQLYIDIATQAGQRIVFETLALALGMSRMMLSSRINGKTRQTEEQRRVWQWVRSIVDSALSEYAHSGESNAITSFFFARNNQGYTNEDPKDVVSNQNDSVEQTNEEIAAKYGDLPD